MGTKKAKAPKPPPPPKYPRVIETMHEPSECGSTVDIHLTEVPSVGNFNVQFRRYRVTIEEIEEPVDVLAARLRELWEASTNHHDWEPLRRAAAEIGITLDAETRGKRRTRNP